MGIVRLFNVIGLDRYNVTVEKSFTKLSSAMDCCHGMLQTLDYRSVTIKYEQLDYSHALIAKLRHGRLHKSVHMSKHTAKLAAKELIELGQLSDDPSAWKVIELPEDEVFS